MNGRTDECMKEFLNESISETVSLWVFFIGVSVVVIFNNCVTNYPIGGCDLLQKCKDAPEKSHFICTQSARRTQRPLLGLVPIQHIIHAESIVQWRTKQKQKAQKIRGYKLQISEKRKYIQQIAKILHVHVPALEGVSTVYHLRTKHRLLDKSATFSILATFHVHQRSCISCCVCPLVGRSVAPTFDEFPAYLLA